MAKQTTQRRKPIDPQCLVDRTQALHVFSFFMNLTMAAKQQTDTASWQRFGGMEAEQVLDAWFRAGPHPFLQDYEARKTRGGHPAPSLRMRDFQHLAVLLATALQRTGLPLGKARKRTAKAFSEAGFLGRPITEKMIEHWDLGASLSAQDDALIENALARCGTDREAVVRHFLDFVRLPWLPWHLEK